MLRFFSKLLFAPEGAGTSGGGGGGGGGGAGGAGSAQEPEAGGVEPSPPSTPPDLAKTLAALNESLGKLGGRLTALEKPKAKGKAKSEPEKPTVEPAENASPPITREEVAEIARQQRDLGAALALIPDDARAELEAELEEGTLSVSAAIKQAERIRKLIPAAAPQGETGDVDKPPTQPRGKPASGARSGGETITTWKQWQKFKAENPREVSAYQTARPGFTPSKLPGGPRSGR